MCWCSKSVQLRWGLPLSIVCGQRCVCCGAARQETLRSFAKSWACCNGGYILSSTSLLCLPSPTLLSTNPRRHVPQARLQAAGPHPAPPVRHCAGKTRRLMRRGRWLEQLALLKQASVKQFWLSSLDIGWSELVTAQPPRVRPTCLSFSPINCSLIGEAPSRRCRGAMAAQLAGSCAPVLTEPRIPTSFDCPQGDAIKAPLWDVAAQGPTAYPSNAAFVQQ